jgi:hypothetical protein
MEVRFIMNLKKILGILILILFIIALSSCEVLDLLVTPQQPRENPADTLTAIQGFSRVYNSVTDSIEISWSFPTDSAYAPKTLLLVRREGAKALSSIKDTADYPDDLRVYLKTDEISYSDVGLKKDTTFWYTIFWSMEAMSEADTDTISLDGSLSLSASLILGTLTQSITLNPTIDGYIDSMNMSYFSSQDLRVYASSYNEISLLSFDNDFESMNVISSYLRLNTSMDNTMMDRSYDVNRIILNWNESDGGATLYSNFGVTDTNVSTDVSESANLIIPMSMFSTYDCDVTAIVNKWSLGEANFGIRLQATTMDATFYSSDTALSSDWPELEVNYSSGYYALEDNF